MKEKEPWELTTGNPALNDGGFEFFEQDGQQWIRHCAWCISVEEVEGQYPGLQITSGICATHFAETFSDLD